MSNMLIMMVSANPMLSVFFYGHGCHAQTRRRICSLHETKRIASSSILAAMQAGICRFEATLGVLGRATGQFP